MQLDRCLIPVDTAVAIGSHDWVEPIIGETVMQCRDCLHVITLDEAWTEEDARHMAAQVEKRSDEEGDVAGGEPSAPTEH